MLFVILCFVFGYFVLMFVFCLFFLFIAVEAKEEDQVNFGWYCFFPVFCSEILLMVLVVTYLLTGSLVLIDVECSWNLFWYQWIIFWYKGMFWLSSLSWAGVPPPYFLSPWNNTWILLHNYNTNQGLSRENLSNAMQHCISFNSYMTGICSVNQQVLSLFKIY